MDFGEGGGEGRFRDVGHEDGSTFAGEEDGGFEANAAGVGHVSVGNGILERLYILGYDEEWGRKRNGGMSAG